MSALISTVFATAATLAAPSASAAWLVGLVEGKTLVLIETETQRIARTVTVSGAQPLIGIDVRPADGKLYGVAADGTIVWIDIESGWATEKSKLKTALPSGATATVDFNPAADRMRIIGRDGTNLRANVDDGTVATDGALKFSESDPNKGKAPKVSAGAYTNAFSGAKETALYDIDTATANLVKQAPPNDGVLSAVGALGMTLDGAVAVAFDIESDGKGGNRAWLVANNWLATVDLSTGRLMKRGKVQGTNEAIVDIAVLPAPR